MSEPTSTKRIWLFLLEQGGMWTVQEIREALPVRVGPLSRTLAAMVSAGSLVESKKQGEPRAYGVTLDCVSAGRSSVREILEAQKP